MGPYSAARQSRDKGTADPIQPSVIAVTAIKISRIQGSISILVVQQSQSDTQSKSCNIVLHLPIDSASRRTFIGQENK